MSNQNNGTITNNVPTVQKSFTLYVRSEPFEVQKLGHRRAKGWRKSLESTLSAILPQLGVFEDSNLKSVDLTDLSKLEALLGTTFSLVEEALDGAIELIISYAGEQLGPKETVLDDMFDEEVVDNFIAVIRAAIPFDHLVKMFKTVTVGQSPATTSQNSPSTNGESLTTTA